MRHHFFSKNPKNQPTQKFEDGTLIRFYNIENYYRPKCICVFDIVFVFVFVYLSFCICFLFLGLYQDLGPDGGAESSSTYRPAWAGRSYKVVISFVEEIITTLFSIYILLLLRYLWCFTQICCPGTRKLAVNNIHPYLSSALITSSPLWQSISMFDRLISFPSCYGLVEEFLGSVQLNLQIGRV